MRFDCDRFSLRILLGAAVCVLAIAPVQAASYNVSLDQLAHQLTADIAKSDLEVCRGRRLPRRQRPEV